MQFEVTESEMGRIRTWAAEQDAIVVARQRKERATSGGLDPFLDALAEDGIAYYGAIGGELTYCFSPNSLGTVFVVKHEGTGAELNLTDYDSW